MQISSLIRTLHGLSLTSRCLQSSRILVDGDSKGGRGKARYEQVEKVRSSSTDVSVPLCLLEYGSAVLVLPIFSMEL